MAGMNDKQVISRQAAIEIACRLLKPGALDRISEIDAKLFSGNWTVFFYPKLPVGVVETPGFEFVVVDATTGQVQLN